MLRVSGNHIIFSFAFIQLEGGVFGYMEEGTALFVYGSRYYTIVDLESDEIKQCVNNEVTIADNGETLELVKVMKEKIGNNYIRLDNFEQFTEYERKAFDSLKDYLITGKSDRKTADFMKYTTPYSVQRLMNDYVLVTRPGEKTYIFDKKTNKFIEKDVYGYVVEGGKIFIYGFHGYFVVDTKDNSIKHLRENLDSDKYTLPPFSWANYELIGNLKDFTEQERQVLSSLKSKI